MSSGGEPSGGGGSSGGADLQESFRSMRKVIAPSLARISATWSDCRNVLWNTRNVAYIVCLLSIVLFVSILLSFGPTFVLFLVGALTIFSVYGALVVSKQSCFAIFDNAMVNAIAKEEKTTPCAAAAAAAAAAARQP